MDLWAEEGRGVWGDSQATHSDTSKSSMTTPCPWGDGPAWQSLSVSSSCGSKEEFPVTQSSAWQQSGCCVMGLILTRRFDENRAILDAGGQAARECGSTAGSSSWREDGVPENTLPPSAPTAYRSVSFVLLFYTLPKMPAAVKSPLPALCRVLRVQPPDPGASLASAGLQHCLRLPKSFLWSCISFKPACSGMGKRGIISCVASCCSRALPFGPRRASAASQPN